LVGGKPLLQIAVERLGGLIPPDRVLVITSGELVDVTCRAAPALPPENVIGEPFGRDTAAACALALAVVRRRDPAGILCVLTADHIIGDLESFHATLREGAVVAAEHDALITIGIQPTFPSTGFGYIESGKPIEHSGRIAFARAAGFVEKPDRATAERYLATGRYYWNSGMFIWTAPTFAQALTAYQPPLAAMVREVEPAVGTDGFARKLRHAYAKLEKISIDYAIMEKADNIIMARGTFAWDDVGSWPALEHHFDKDNGGNVRIGACEAIDAHNNVVVSKERLTALIGVDDLVVVQAPGATLVCRKERAQDVKHMVRLLAEAGGYEHLL
ncbi:MAG: mannose-1-phosphate guanylyltransferase, partial [Lentisphaerae bacterium]|nr:mannose-1-phosphate guanylyltransferase [Lentisphaerota bacterium]